MKRNMSHLRGLFGLFQIYLHFSRHDHAIADREGEEGGRSTAALSLDQSTDLRYKATILVPNFVKKVGTFFGLGTQLKRMK